MGAWVIDDRHRPLPSLRAGRRGPRDRPRPRGGPARRTVAGGPRVGRRRPDPDQQGRLLRRAADLRRLRRPDGHAGRASGRVRRGCRPAADERPAAHPRAGPVPHRRAPSGRVAGRRDSRRRRRAVVGLRDPERRVHGAPPVPPGGRGLRPGREDRPAQSQGPRLHDVEPRRAEPRAECRVHGRARSGRPAVGELEHGVRPVLRVDPVLPPPRRPNLGRGLVVPRQRVPHALRLLPARGVPHPRRGRAVRRVRLRRAAAPRCRRGVHAPDREGRPAAAVGAGIPPVPMVRLHPGGGRGAGGAAPRPAGALRRTLARHRLHGRLSRLHVGRGEVPGPGRHAGAARGGGIPRRHDHRPRRQARPRLLGLRPGARARRAVPHRGR